VDDLRGRREDRWHAARALRNVPPDRIAAVVPVLGAALDDPDKQVRLSAIDTLGAFDTLAGAAAPALRRLLEASDEWQKSAAAAALVRVEPRPDPALVPLFVEWLSSIERTIRERALDSLDAIGPGAAAAVPALVRLLNDPDAAVQARAAEVLGSIGPVAAASAGALKKLAADAPSSRAAEAAERALEGIGAVAPSQTWGRVVAESDVTTALRQFQSADPELRRKGLDAIEAHREAAAAAVPALVAALGDWDVPFRYQVAYTLTTVAPAQAAPALPVLKQMMRSDVAIPNTSPRVLAPIGLGRLGVPGAEALVEALSDRAPETRQPAALGLMNSDEFPPSAVPALLSAMRDVDETVRMQSLSTLISRKADAALMVPAMIAALTDSSRDVRSQAASGLGMYGSASRRAVPALKEMARDADPTIAMSAGSSLAAIDPDAAIGLLPFFIVELSGSSPGTFQIGRPDGDLSGPTRRLQALNAIDYLGPRAASALPVLRRILERDHGIFQRQAAMAIVSVDPKATPEIVAAFIDALERADDGETHFGVLTALEFLGPRAAAAEPAVTRLLSSGDPAIRQAATEALGAIRVR
jgi:HEAT repeat protein